LKKPEMAFSKGSAMARSLKNYKDKRNFDRTPEPKGDVQRQLHSPFPIFVIQKHDATALHYDVRLEMDGILKSWAVPKGPSMNPQDKRLAVQTEDHPIEYAEFEGVIPEGQYGAGPCIIWDIGVFTNIRDKSLEASLEEGKIEVHLYGQKITGAFALIRRSKSESNQWLLVKMRDRHASSNFSPVASEPASIISGRTIEQMDVHHGINPDQNDTQIERAS
jgi:DNA ligase D-like protein (predicted 3'-phosphoesterase)